MALGLTKHLCSLGLSAKYAHLHGQPHPLQNKLNIPYYPLDLNQFLENYLANKLNSKIIASWITKTPFIDALVSMIPSLGYLILLGELFKVLKENEDLILILDSPATGHALTMLEAPANFKKILKTGIIADDIDMINRFMQDEKQMKVFICCLANQMAIQEGLEMKEKLSDLSSVHTEMIINNSLVATPLKKKDLPDFLQKKWTWESDIINKSRDQIKTIIPHSSFLKPNEMLMDLMPHFEALV
ncbi:MAG: ArsA-related P-loop ATPase [Pseudomonadota bacterium]